MKRVQFPGGPTAQEDQIIGLPRQVRVDETGQNLRLHNGSTPGGVEIPNEDRVKQLIASGSEGAVGTTRILANTAELAALSPDANTIAIVRGVNEEDIFVWKSGAGDEGTIPSAIDGYWQRLDSAAGTIVRMWRAGLLNLQVDGAEPASDQDVTVWLTGGVVKMWDGTEYIDATPETYARLMASIGGYYTGTVSIPDRIASVAVTVDENNIDLITESGWFLVSSAVTFGMPVTGTHVVMTIRNGSNGYQIIFVRGAPGDMYIRTYSGGVWGGWTYLSGQLPGRLSTTGAACTDANSALETGFYVVGGSAANIPVGSPGVIEVFNNSAGNLIQFYLRRSANGFYMRRQSGGAWSSWVRIIADDEVTPLSRGGTGATNATDARSNLGLGTLATLNSPVPLANGGTAATSASGARSNLGLGALATQDTVSLSSQVTGQLSVALGGTGANDVAEMRSEFSLYSKAEVDSLTANKAGYYTGSAHNNVNYPVGSLVIANMGSEGVQNRNDVEGVQFRGENEHEFQLTDSSTNRLTGTWRSKGYIGGASASYFLMQRTA